MKRSLSLPTLALAAAFASTSIAATVPADQARTQGSATTVKTQQAQDSANGSMTNTDLSGNVDQDTSALTSGTTSGTTSGAIIDQTARKKKKKGKKKQTAPTEESASSAEGTSSGTSSSGDYGNENLNSPVTTEGRTRNDEIGLGRNGIDTSVERSGDSGQSSTGGGGH